MPVERPDFEPPPAWARPTPSESASGRGTGGPLPHGGGAGGRGRRWAPLIAIVAATALITGALGATAGVWFGPRFLDQPSAAQSQEPEDDFGNEDVALPKPEDVSTVADAMLPSTVHIQVRGAGAAGEGSGFVLSDEGYVLTNNHVIAPAAEEGQIELAFHDGTEVGAEVVGRSPSYDLAVLQVADPEAVELRPVALGESEPVGVGEPIVAIGAPLGLAGTVTSGIVSAKDRPVTAGGEGEIAFINALQLDAAINPGNSGGPLVNLQAEVVGVNSAIATLSEDSMFGEGGPRGNIGLGFAIPIDQARRTAQQIIDNGYAVYPVIGAEVDGSFGGSGVRIAELSASSPAGEAGLRAGDLITAIDNEPVGGADDLIVQIRSRVPGEQVELTYERGGQQETTTVTLSEERG